MSFLFFRVRVTNMWVSARTRLLLLLAACYATAADARCGGPARAGRVRQSRASTAHAVHPPCTGSSAPCIPSGGSKAPRSHVPRTHTRSTCTGPLALCIPCTSLTAPRYCTRSHALLYAAPTQATCTRNHIVTRESTDPCQRLRRRRCNTRVGIASVRRDRSRLGSSSHRRSTCSSAPRSCHRHDVGHR